MELHNVDLEALLKEYERVIYDLELEIAEAKRKKEIVLETIEIWEREGILDLCPARKEMNMRGNELS